jgi:hypothetical protein
MIVFLGCMAGGIIPGVGVLFLVVAVVAAMMWSFSLILRFVGWLCYSNDPEYQRFRKLGGDPYFYFLPEGVNNDTWAERVGGRPEPKTNFQPPKEWCWQCNSCGARNEAPSGPCWNCGNNLSNGRVVNCWRCGKPVREASFGDLDNGGVICPYCEARLVSPPAEAQT